MAWRVHSRVVGRAARRALMGAGASKKGGIAGADSDNSFPLTLKMKMATAQELAGLKAVATCFRCWETSKRFVPKAGG